MHVGTLQKIKRHPIIRILLLFLLPLALVYAVGGLCVASFGGGFVIPPQDCEMTAATLRGKVVDASGKPIPNAVISLENKPVDRSTPVKLTLHSDQTGAFGPEQIRFFKCESLNFTIQAQDYQIKMASYILDYGLLNTLPQELNISLERAS